MANSIEVLVPDIGGFKDVAVIDVLVKDGQQIEKEAPLITIETEKAAMDVPAPAAGRISHVKLKQGDKVSEGSLILLLEATITAPPPVATNAPTGAPPTPQAAPPPGSTSTRETAPTNDAATPRETQTTRQAAPREAERREEPPREAAGAPVATIDAVTPPVAAAAGGSRGPIDESGFSKAYASPSVRKFAREVGADLGAIVGTGPKARITQEDVKAHVKKILTKPVAAASSLPKVPDVNFAKFGAIEIKALSRIQRISGARLQASWINLPHVTQHDYADITELEAIRGALKSKASQDGVKLTPLAFILRACVVALKEFPTFNASLDASGENLVYKKYYHIGFAAETPNGLVVPVIRDADGQDLFGIARALAALSEKARAGKLSGAEMQGGTFTISSLAALVEQRLRPLSTLLKWLFGGFEIQSDAGV